MWKGSTCWPGTTSMSLLWKVKAKKTKVKSWWPRVLQRRLLPPTLRRSRRTSSQRPLGHDGTHLLRARAASLLSLRWSGSRSTHWAKTRKTESVWRAPLTTMRNRSLSTGQTTCRGWEKACAGSTLTKFKVRSGRKSNGRLRSEVWRRIRQRETRSATIVRTNLSRVVSSLI